MLEHLCVEDASVFLKECRRILRPGGIVRIVVPDLEAITRRYIHELDSARLGDPDASIRRDWMVHELIDQLTRHQSGGEITKWWSKHPVPQKDFIISRVGAEAQQSMSYLQRRSASVPRIDSRDPSVIGSFRLSGEVHRWMYDELSLREALLRSGLHNAKRVEAGESSINNWAQLPLDIEYGRVRKPDSLFMEAKK
jgi:hypothetical protein